MSAGYLTLNVGINMTIYTDILHRYALKVFLKHKIINLPHVHYFRLYCRFI